MEKETKANWSAKDYFLTYSKCPLSLEDFLLFLKHKFIHWNWIAVSQEHHEDGSLHLHAAVQSTKVKVANEKNLRWHNYMPNIQIRRGTYEQVMTYLKKEQFGIIEIGEFKRHKTKQELTAEKNELILSTPLPLLVKDGSISIFNYQQLKKAKNAYSLDSVKPPAIIKRECFWIYGDPGCGKTYYVRTLYDTIFVKPQNKWWDGYCGEDVVLLDDFDCKMLGHYIKIWADCYSFNVELKGDTIIPSYTKFYITSNYLPETIFSDDPTLAAAVRRRFKFAKINLDYTLSYDN